jgi:hypothetical protein
MLACLLSYHASRIKPEIFTILVPLSSSLHLLSSFFNYYLYIKIFSQCYPEYPISKYLYQRNCLHDWIVLQSIEKIFDGIQWQIQVIKIKLVKSFKISQKPLWSKIVNKLTLYILRGIFYSIKFNLLHRDHLLPSHLWKSNYKTPKCNNFLIKRRDSLIRFGKCK